MKKFLFPFGLICLTFPVFGQFSVGFSTAANVAQMKWYLKPLDLQIDYEPAIGWRATVLGEWQVSPQLAFRAEIGGQLKRNKIELTNDEGDRSGALRQNLFYWEGSVLTQVSPVKAFKHWYLVIGGTAGYLANGWEKIAPALLEAGANRKRSIDVDQANYNRRAISADFGLGAKLPLNPRSSIKLEGRFQYGLLDVSTHENVDAQFNPFVLSVGYLYQL